MNENELQRWWYMTCKIEPRYQCVFVSLEMFAIKYNKSVVYCSGGVFVGPDVLLVSLASIVPFGRLGTSCAVS